MRGEGGEEGREWACLGFGDEGEEEGEVTLGEGSSKQEENSSKVEPIILRPSLNRGKVAKGLIVAPPASTGAL